MSRNSRRDRRWDISEVDPGIAHLKALLDPLPLGLT